MKKVFISHSSKDLAYVECIIELLEAVGVQSERIFCSSVPGYSITPGNDFLDAIRNELNHDTLVCFIISSNFYMSKMCLCELGASWVKTLNHFPILIPPLEYNDLDLLLRNTQSAMINKRTDINLLYNRISSWFELQPLDPNIWELRRDRVLIRIEEMIKKKQ